MEEAEISKTKHTDGIVVRRPPSEKKMTLIEKIGVRETHTGQYRLPYFPKTIIEWNHLNYTIVHQKSVDGFKSPLAKARIVCLFVGCLTSRQQASVSQGRICSDNFTCCHTEIEVADPTFYLTQSQYTDTWPTSPSADPILPGAWQGSHWRANF